MLALEEKLTLSGQHSYSPCTIKAAHFEQALTKISPSVSKMVGSLIHHATWNARISDLLPYEILIALPFSPEQDIRVYENLAKELKAA